MPTPENKPTPQDADAEVNRIAEMERIEAKEEKSRKSQECANTEIPVADITEIVLQVGMQAMETTGEVCVSVAKVGVEVVGSVIGGALDGL